MKLNRREGIHWRIKDIPSLMNIRRMQCRKREMLGVATIILIVVVFQTTVWIAHWIIRLKSLNHLLLLILLINNSILLIIHIISLTKVNSIRSNHSFIIKHLSLSIIKTITSIVIILEGIIPLNLHLIITAPAAVIVLIIMQTFIPKIRVI